jgi:hypothetical protein
MTKAALGDHSVTVGEHSSLAVVVHGASHCDSAMGPSARAGGTASR